MIEQVLQAIRGAFQPDRMVSHLNETAGRVYGSVDVVGSPIFDSLDDIRRQRLLWQKLDEVLGAQCTQVGPIVLEPINRG
jgi:hypothetical protein